MSKFLNKKYESLTPYVPGEQPQGMKYIKLNTNESPYPPSPEVFEAVNSNQVSLLRLYSDPCCTKITEKLSALYKVSPEQIFFSNGSDDILSFAFMAFSGESCTAVFPDITYGFYKVFAALHGTDYKEIPLQSDFSVNYKDYCGLNKFIVIANPNAPTGLTLSLIEIEEILKSNPGNVVLIDEAYVDFGGESCYPLTAKYDNLLVVQTFSKSRSMAGARLGFAVGSKELIDDLNKIKYSTNPYNINRLTMVAGEAALDSEEYYLGNCRLIAKTRDYTRAELEKKNFSVLPSSANFLLAKHDFIEGKILYDRLKSKGILVRRFDTPRIKDYIRITIGTENEIRIFLKTIDDILSNLTEA